MYVWTSRLISKYKLDVTKYFYTKRETKAKYRK